MILRLLIILLSTTLPLKAQKLISSDSKITFYSEATLENISATTTKGNGIINLSNSEFAFSVPIKDFQFRKSLMKEHFNEKYMESELYPRATFLGKISDSNSSNSNQRDVVATGKFTIHGVTREVQVPATLKKVGDKNYVAHAVFRVKLDDYNIKRPQLLWQNIAEEVEVTVDFTFKAK
jgi:polyisoprenoid-binding protein YceI